jgi:GMP synthase-like glutamine amidotransferase
MTVHIGILQTDSVLDHLKDEFGDYPAMFMELFSKLDTSITFSIYVVQDGLPQSINCDAYLVTGSRHSVYDDAPWIFELAKFIAKALNEDKKLIGICFGHQLMAHFFGGKVAMANAGWAVGVHTSEIQHRNWMPDGALALNLLSSHKDQVQKLPDHATLFASNEFCPFAGFTMSDQVITIQGHPEFAKSYARALMNHREEILGKKTHREGIASLSKELHSERFIEWALHFIKSDSHRPTAILNWQAINPRSMDQPGSQTSDKDEYEA